MPPVGERLEGPPSIGKEAWQIKLAGKGPTDKKLADKAICFNKERI